MEEIHRQLLRSNRVFLVDMLQINQKFIDILLKKNIILKDHAERILIQQTSADKAAEFLRLIVKRGPTAMYHLMETLIETGQFEIAQALDSTIYNHIIETKDITWTKL